MPLDRTPWLVSVLLILGLLLPTACVLWFMNDAATSQAAAARQSVTEAYRNQLPLLRDRIDAYWFYRTADIDRQLGPHPGASDFASVVRSGLADSVITPLYPPPTPHFNPDAKPDPTTSKPPNLKSGNLVQAGNKPAALQAIQGHFIPRSPSHRPRPPKADSSPPTNNSWLSVSNPPPRA